MRSWLLCTALLAAASTGCTHHQLSRSTVLTTSTVMDIQYRIVLMNLAMLSCHPEGFPCHIDLADGVVQINDELGFGEAGAFTTFGGTRFGIERFGPFGSRQVTEQWGADATLDPQRLVKLQDLYRAGLGLDPLPPPNAIAYLRQARAEQKGKKDGDDKGGKKKEGDGNGGGGAFNPASPAPLPRPRTLPSPHEESENQPAPASTGGGGSTPSADGSSGGDGDRDVPIEVLLTDVPPPGWYHLGGKKDVPKNACYVGRYGDRYAWVMPEGMPALARFTVTVLAVVKFKPSPAAGRQTHGLAVTR